jgi:hypothetical protein
MQPRGIDGSELPSLSPRLQRYAADLAAILGQEPPTGGRHRPCLLGRYRIALWVAIVLPLLGGSGALVRIFTANPTPFTYFHTLIDFVVVGLCIHVLALGRTRSAAS